MNLDQNEAPPQSATTDRFDSFTTSNEPNFSFSTPFNMNSTFQDRLNPDPDKMQGTSPFPLDEEMSETPIQEDEDFDIDLDVGDMVDGKYDDGDIDLDIEVDFDGSHLGFPETDMQMASPMPEEQPDMVLEDIASAHEEDIELRDRATVPHSPALVSDPLPFADENNQPDAFIDNLASVQQISPNFLSPLVDKTETSFIEEPISTADMPTTTLSEENTAGTGNNETHVSIIEGEYHSPSKITSTEVENSFTQIFEVSHDVQQPPSPTLPPAVSPLPPPSSLVIDSNNNDVRTSQADTIPLTDDTPVLVQKEWSTTSSATIANESPRGNDLDPPQPSPRSDFQGDEPLYTFQQDEHVDVKHNGAPEREVSPLRDTEVANLQDEETKNPFQEHDESLIHPVVVSYKDSEYPLFRTSKLGYTSTDSELTFFDSHDCIWQPFGQIVHEIRQILGFDIKDNHEILLSFESINLSLEENNTGINRFTLSDIIDIYLNIHVDHEQSLPLVIKLDTRLGYAEHLDMLRGHLSSGGNINNLPAYHDPRLKIENSVGTQATEIRIAQATNTANGYNSTVYTTSEITVINPTGENNETLSDLNEGGDAGLDLEDFEKQTLDQVSGNAELGVEVESHSEGDRSAFRSEDGNLHKQTARQVKTESSYLHNQDIQPAITVTTTADDTYTYTHEQPDLQTDTEHVSLPASAPLDHTNEHAHNQDTEQKLSEGDLHGTGLPSVEHQTETPDMNTLETSETTPRSHLASNSQSPIVVHGEFGDGHQTGFEDNEFQDDQSESGDSNLDQAETVPSAHEDTKAAQTMNGREQTSHAQLTSPKEHVTDPNRESIFKEPKLDKDHYESAHEDETRRLQDTGYDQKDRYHILSASELNNDEPSVDDLSQVGDDKDAYDGAEEHTYSHQTYDHVTDDEHEDYGDTGYSEETSIFQSNDLPITAGKRPREEDDDDDDVISFTDAESSGINSKRRRAS